MEKLKSKTNQFWNVTIDLSDANCFHNVITELERIIQSSSASKFQLTLISKPKTEAFLGNVSCEYLMYSCSSQSVIPSKKLSLDHIDDPILLTFEDIKRKQDLILFRSLRKRSQIASIISSLEEDGLGSVTPSRLFFNFLSIKINA